MNEENIMAVKAAITGVLACLSALWGWMGWVVIIWILLMITDWLVGTALASRHGTWSSAKLREGALHKAGMILTFVIALTADWLIRITLEHLPLVSLPFDYSVLLSPLVAVWYIIGELGSLAEHAVSTGAPVPRWLLNILEAGRRAIDSVGKQISKEHDDRSAPD